SLADGAAGWIATGQFGETATGEIMKNLEQMAALREEQQRPKPASGNYIPVFSKYGTVMDNVSTPKPMEYEGMQQAVQMMYTVPNPKAGQMSGRAYLSGLRTEDAKAWRDNPQTQPIPAARLRADLERAIALADKEQGELIQYNNRGTRDSLPTISNQPYFDQLSEDIKLYKKALGEMDQKRGKTGQESLWNGYGEREAMVDKRMEVYAREQAKRPELPAPQQMREDLETLADFRRMMRNPQATTTYTRNKPDGSKETVTTTWTERANGVTQRLMGGQIEQMMADKKKGVSGQKALEDNRLLEQQLNLDPITSSMTLLTNPEQLEKAALQYRKPGGKPVNMLRDLGVPSPSITRMLETSLINGNMTYDSKRVGQEAMLTPFPGDPLAAEKTEVLAMQLQAFGLVEGKDFA
ncbi:MAG: hypothetical protein K2Q01_04325, partial [Rickettsiales bacterium]|nr:hypothetical protein [Rickettsiales bacterium]